MKISGFTIARNAIKFNYPLLESIQSILPLCNEFIVNVGDSDDKTLELIQSLKNDKIRIIQNKWDLTRGKEVLSEQTNLAIKECKGDWAFYLQSDEVVHEKDLSRIRSVMKESLADRTIDALRFRWFHFYGSYFRYRIDSGWYQKQNRIIRNNGEIESFGDAFGFRRKDNRPLKFKNTHCFIYHYGWVHPTEVMASRIENAQQIGFAAPRDSKVKGEYAYADLNQFPIYFASHPKIMQSKIAAHNVSQEDQLDIDRRYWWYLPKILKFRYKTGRRVREQV